MATHDIDCALNFGQLTDSERWAYLVRQNAYYIWERRVKADTPGTPEEDWTTAEAEVAKGWKVWFTDGFLESLHLPAAIT